ncbi:hypothetical protein [Myxococcus eversor]|uniref:hypothetical protein n=1 Tax=Myxococcus eversor TaxID=2709661 RepID=UPI0013CF4A34|nr:hypothetical protein [Myxococcus eversor]
MATARNLKAAEADNAALLAELRQVLRWANRYHHKDVAESLDQLLAQPHPGTALLERLRTLEEALSDAAQDLKLWAAIPSVPSGIQRALAKRAEGIRALLDTVKS